MTARTEVTTPSPILWGTVTLTSRGWGSIVTHRSHKVNTGGVYGGMVGLVVVGVVLDAGTLAEMGDCERAHEIANSYLNAASSCVDGIPVVGHAKGIVHYAMGDKEKGHKSMEASTRNVAVLGAGIATGGLGAGLALGATAGIGAGVAYDATATIVDGAVNGKDSKLHGTIALARPDEMTPNEFVGGIIGIAGDGLTGAGGAQMGRNIRTRINGQRNLQNAYKNSQRLKRTGTDYRTATQVTMEAAEASKKAQGALNKQMNYATCEAVDSATGYVRDGFVMQAAGAATVGYAMNNDEDDETDSD
ncbi:hypothetical protein E2C01_003840 [Portunus trituberculatus]|uniref:Uncharacterized protein n=1 Tax=Portunus trituberculatus TaxID=210409 RepID=A0A5B7CQU4_PORTR|nr:hypothetical protein [Portunus trituberculatus]